MGWSLGTANPGRLGGWSRSVPPPMRLLPQESEHLRSAAFTIYTTLLAKIKRRFLIFPLKHQVLNLLILTVLHLQDRDPGVAQVRGRRGAGFRPLFSC